MKLNCGRASAPMFMIALAAMLGFWLQSAPAHAMTVTDLAGREVEIPERVERIVLGESRYIPVLAILDREQPLQRIVGMLGDLRQVDPGSYRQYHARFPQIAAIPLIGHASADSFSIEQALALKADLAIFGLEGHGPSSHDAALVERLEMAGVAVLFVDFRREPLRNTPRSMALLGQALDREAEAEAFIAFYAQALGEVTRGLADLPASSAPKVFLHSRVGLQGSCCETMVNGMMGHFIDAVGAVNVARGMVPGSAGVISLEHLLVNQPDAYIATATGSADAEDGAAVSSAAIDNSGYVVLGAGVEPARARASLARAVAQSGVVHLNAVRDGRAFALWHHFYNTPLNVAAVQALAKWLYPDRFQNLDPRATLETLFERFQPVPLNGTYWVALDALDARGQGDE